MFRPLNLTDDAILRGIARDAAGKPAMVAESADELTLLSLASRVSPVQVIQVDPGQLTVAGGAADSVRMAVRFPSKGVVVSLAFAEIETGVIRDQEVQIFSTQGLDATLGFDENLNAAQLNCEALFGLDRHELRVAYLIRSRDDTWSVTLANLRSEDTSHPVLQIGFVPDKEARGG